MPSKVQATYRSASLVGSDRVVFRIKGNKYPLIVRVDYRRGVVYIRFMGTHPVGLYQRKGDLTCRS